MDGVWGKCCVVRYRGVVVAVSVFINLCGTSPRRRRRLATAAVVIRYSREESLQSIYFWGARESSERLCPIVFKLLFFLSLDMQWEY